MHSKESQKLSLQLQLFASDLKTSKCYDSDVKAKI